ncbi:hypothetical protein DOTSEDRAFT_34825 [Dothistroma septosporum NZE10]|uniref:F-box domain-containing protein n=1 Tax=Dothistroma septosporum (strain NZE10 / CBS 128990) TaxID=675120 RepID=N1PN75_DOTSN|nr:hypothetical protein DOTSEDRAFT_34825 [Dothistroma septosporum NZE10]
MSVKHLLDLPAEVLVLVSSSIEEPQLLDVRLSCKTLDHAAFDHWADKVVENTTCRLGRPNALSKIDNILATPHLARLLQKLEAASCTLSLDVKERDGGGEFPVFTHNLCCALLCSGIKVVSYDIGSVPFYHELLTCPGIDTIAALSRDVESVTYATWYSPRHGPAVQVASHRVILELMRYARGLKALRHQMAHFRTADENMGPSAQVSRSYLTAAPYSCLSELEVIRSACYTVDLTAFLERINNTLRKFAVADVTFVGDRRGFVDVLQQLQACSQLLSLKIGIGHVQSHEVVADRGHRRRSRVQDSHRLGVAPYADPDSDREPDTMSSYVEAISNRWFAVFIRVPHDHKPKGDVFVLRVFLDGRIVVETWRQRGDQLPLTPQPEGEAGFDDDDDVPPTYEPGLAKGAREMEQQQRARSEEDCWMMQGRTDGMSMRFPHKVTNYNQHQPGDAAEWDGKEIVVQFSEAYVLEAPTEDAWGNYIAGKAQTVGDILAFTFIYRPRKILDTIIGQTKQLRSSATQVAHDPKSPDSDKSARPSKDKGRASSIESNSTVRRNMPAAAAGTKGNDKRKPIWNYKTYQVERLTETEFAQRMHNPQGIHPADQQWRDNLTNFNSKWMYCCRRMRPNTKFVWCDNKDCEIGIFHFRCVGLTSEPHWGGRLWLCPICRDLPDQEVRI